MNYEWYQIFNLAEWLATGLVQRSLVVNLESRGRTTFLITQGNTTAVSLDDGFLPVNFLDMNPYVQGDRAVYLDADGNVWFGFAV